MSSTLAAYNFPHFIGKNNYELALNQSIEALLQNPNSTNFTSDFEKFVQSKLNPPLESIWIFTALSFKSPRIPKTEPLGRISAIKDLFQLIVSLSASCNSIKSIALVAPVIYNLHNFILELKSFRFESKEESKVNREIKSLIDSVLGYISVCCNGYDENVDDLEVFIRPLGDLISFWLVDNGVQLQNKNVESFRVFFPLLSDGIVKRVSVGGCEMIDLAGFAVAEAFLLKLCWKIRDEGFGEKMRKEIKSWVVGSVTGLGNSYFYVTLVSMLLEPVLPIASVMNLEHGDGLRKVLFDALILVEYSFLGPESLGKLPVKHAKRVIFTKLMAAYEAIELFRDNGDQTKVITYLNAFASSDFRGLVKKWIRSEIGNEFSTNEPNGTSPKAFLRWMLNIENRGIKLFDDDISEFRNAFNSKEQSEQLPNIKEGKKLDSDILFYIDKNGQEENGTEKDDQMNEGMNAAFMAAAHSMQSADQGERKRKTKNGEKKEQVKFVKYNALKDFTLSGQRAVVPRNDDSDSASEIEKPSSDEEM